MSAPIVLIHYGNSSYLPYVVQVAKRFNPHKEIIFLGDEQNAYLAALGVSHHRFATSCGSPELERFNQLYPRIVNPNYPKSRWAQFVLQRWFMINTFLHRHEVDRFWTFDSDTYILTDLTLYENHLSNYECTSQWRGQLLLNGFVSGRTVVQKYISKINQLLSDDDFVRSWHLQYEENSERFFNEMEAFAIFVEQEHVRTFHLPQIRDSAMFDDSITYDDGMEMYRKTIKGRRVKKLYLRDGSLYCRHLSSESFVKMNTLNLSWMPKYIFPSLFEYIVSARSPRSFSELDLLRAPLSYHIKLFIRNRIPRQIRDRISQGAYWV